MMNVLEQVHQMVWGPWTLVIFLGVGIFFTLKCHFFQIRDFYSGGAGPAGRLISGEASQEGSDGTGKGKGISQFQSVCTALAATVGTGNIAGVANRADGGRTRRSVLDVDISPDRHDNRLRRNHAGNQVPVQG